MEKLETSQPPAVGNSWAELQLRHMELNEARSHALEKQRLKSSRFPWTSFNLSLDFFEGLKSIGLFAPRLDWDEGQISILPPELHTAFPRIESGFMTFHQCRVQDLEKNQKHNIFQAPAMAPEIVPEMLIVPCLLADGFGNRIGRGQGHYDKYLAQYPNILRWGLVHSTYVFKELPPSWIQSWDQKLTGLISEKYLIPIQEINL